MTMTDTNGDTDRAAAPADGPSPDDLRALARVAWEESGRTLVGDELGPMFGRSGRTGRNWVTAFRNEAGAKGGKAGGKPAGSQGGKATPPAVKAGGSARPAVPATPTAAKRKVPATPARKAAPAATPLPLLVVTGIAVVVVTAVCAVVSYSHIRDLAAAAGMGNLAGWLPLGIDGLVVACSCSVIVDRRRDHPGHAIAWAGLVLGLAATLAANVAAVDPELVSVRATRLVLAGYAPVALAVSGHLMLRMLGER